MGVCLIDYPQMGVSSGSVGHVTSLDFGKQVNSISEIVEDRNTVTEED